jgi:hypothetical protein
MANPPADSAQAIAPSEYDTGTDMAPTKAPASTTFLPSDVEAARKERINNELVALFRLPCPAKATASVQGIGSYTHTSATVRSGGTATRGPLRPEFLPIGGPNRVLKGKDELEAPLSEELQQLWKQIEAAVNEEEKFFGEAGMSEEQLNERYGALKVPHANAQNQQQWQQYMKALRKLQASKIS